MPALGKAMTERLDRSRAVAKMPAGNAFFEFSGGETFAWPL
jgi:hypothetical protein